MARGSSYAWTRLTGRAVLGLWRTRPKRGPCRRLLDLDVCAEVSLGTAIWQTGLPVPLGRHALAPNRQAPAGAPLPRRDGHACRPRVEQSSLDHALEVEPADVVRNTSMLLVGAVSNTEPLRRVEQGDHDPIGQPVALCFSAEGIPQALRLATRRDTVRASRKYAVRQNRTHLAPSVSRGSSRLRSSSAGAATGGHRSSRRTS